MELKGSYFKEEDVRDIRISNELLDISYVSVDELFLFTHLSSLKGSQNIVRTNLRELSSLVPYVATEKLNRKKIKRFLGTLSDKGLIKVGLEEDKDIEDILSKDKLRVHVLDFKYNYTTISRKQVKGKTPLELRECIHKQAKEVNTEWLKMD